MNQTWSQSVGAKLRQGHRLGQLSALTASDVQAGKDLHSVWRSIRQSLRRNCLFKVVRRRGSALKSLTVYCPNPPLSKRFSQFWVSADLLWSCSFSVLGCPLTSVPVISPSCSTLTARALASHRLLLDVRDSILLPTRKCQIAIRGPALPVHSEVSSLVHTNNSYLYFLTHRTYSSLP